MPPKRRPRKPSSRAQQILDLALAKIETQRLHDNAIIIQDWLQSQHHSIEVDTVPAAGDTTPEIDTVPNPNAALIEVDTVPAAGDTTPEIDTVPNPNAALTEVDTVPAAGDTTPGDTTPEIDTVPNPNAALTEVDTVPAAGDTTPEIDTVPNPNAALIEVDTVPAAGDTTPGDTTPEIDTVPNPNAALTEVDTVPAAGDTTPEIDTVPNPNAALIEVDTVPAAGDTTPEIDTVPNPNAALTEVDTVPAAGDTTPGDTTPEIDTVPNPNAALTEVDTVPAAGNTTPEIDTVLNPNAALTEQFTEAEADVGPLTMTPDMFSLLTVAEIRCSEGSDAQVINFYHTLPGLSVEDIRQILSSQGVSAVEVTILLGPVDASNNSTSECNLSTDVAQAGMSDDASNVADGSQVDRSIASEKKVRSALHIQRNGDAMYKRNNDRVVKVTRMQVARLSVIEV